MTTMPTTSRQPLLIGLAPNGAYKSRDEHHQLPITAAQLADTVFAARQNGVGLLHLHVRDAHCQHTLSASIYQAVSRAIRIKVGTELFVQFTSESAGRYTAAEQRRAIYAFSNSATIERTKNHDAALDDEPTNGSHADGVSIALCELIRTSPDLPVAKKLFHHLAQHNILAQYILYSTADVTRYCALLAQGIIAPDNHSVLFVVGKRTTTVATAPSSVTALHSMLEALQAATKPLPNWMICAFGDGEFACLTEACKLGGHVRIGFENCLSLRDGKPAKDNAELISQFINYGNPTGRPLANAAQARRILGQTIA